MTISAADLAALKARRTTVINRINGWTEGDMGDKADSNQPGAVRHVDYKDGLFRELEWLNEQIRAAEEDLLGGEVVSEGFT